MTKSFSIKKQPGNMSYNELKELLNQVDIAAMQVDASKGSKPRYLIRINPSKHHESLFIKTPTGQIQKKDPHAASTTTASVHQVYKTFSECKKFYKRIFQLTNCTEYDVCTCAQGTCALWSLYPFFRTYYFPSGGLGYTQGSIKKSMTARIPIVNQLFSMVMQHVKLTAGQPDAVGTKECEVIRFLCTFLELNQEVLGHFEQAIGESTSPVRLNLQGWQLYRQTLITHDDNSSANAAVTDATATAAATTVETEGGAVTEAEGTNVAVVQTPMPVTDGPHPLAPLRPILHGLHGLQLSDTPEHQQNTQQQATENGTRQTGESS